MIDETELRLYPQGAERPERSFPGSSRGCKQTLELIPIAQDVFRTLDGRLVSVCTSPLPMKYRSVIRFEDAHPAVCDGVCPGRIMWVECIQRLATQEIPKGGVCKLDRTPVPGSVLLCSWEGAFTPYAGEGDMVKLSTDQGPVFCTYRAKLLMRVTRVLHDTDEWGCLTGCEIHLEEV